jgi:GH25 family lysozyme M1 (1,4-beta-N-acetylmuramidase)
MIIGIDWGSYLDYRGEVMLPWSELVREVGVSFAVFKGAQEQISDYGNYSTVKNIQAARAAGVPIVGCYYWHDPTASPSFLVELYSQAITREQPDFIAVDIEQWDDGNGNKLPPAQISETARLLCEGLRDRHPDKRVIVYSRQNFPTSFSPAMNAWLPAFNGGWVASWPDYGLDVYHAPSWVYVRAGMTRHNVDKYFTRKDLWEVINIADWQPSNMEAWSTWRIWQYSSRMMLPVGSTYGGQLDWNIFNGTLDEMLDWIGKKETSPMAQIYNKLTPTNQRAWVMEMLPTQKSTIPLDQWGVDALILQMASMSFWTGSHRICATEGTFAGRFDQAAAAGVPVIGKFIIDAALFMDEMKSKPELDGHSVWQNIALPGLMGAWAIGAGDWVTQTAQCWDKVRAGTIKFREIKALIIEQTSTKTFKGADLASTWQAYVLGYVVDKLRVLMQAGAIPTVPIIYKTSKEWLAANYNGEVETGLNSRASWMWMAITEETLSSTNVFDDLWSIYQYAPGDTFKWSILPYLYDERVVMLEFSAGNQRMSKMVDAAGAPSAVNLSLWCDTATKLQEFLKTSAVVVTPPPVEPPPVVVTPPPVVVTPPAAGATLDEVMLAIMELRARFDTIFK